MRNLYLMLSSLRGGYLLRQFPKYGLVYFSNVSLKLMNFKIFDKVYVLIIDFKGGVLECPPKVGEGLCLGGAKEPGPLDRGCGLEGEPQEGGRGGKI